LIVNEKAFIGNTFIYRFSLWIALEKLMEVAASGLAHSALLPGLKSLETAPAPRLTFAPDTSRPEPY
jgi:hypothetical protein